MTNNKEIITFDDDLLGLKEFGIELKNFILNEQKFVDDGLVVGLNAKYGYGKTTFLRMWQHYIENNFNDDIAVGNEFCQPLVVNLNAWKSDYIDEPLFVIISELLPILKEHIKESKESDTPSFEIVKEHSDKIMELGNQLFKTFFGIDLKKVIGAEPNESHKDINVFDAYLKRKNVFEELKDSISKILENLPIIFIIDELDRCRPDYAIKYLEVIKHLFDIKGAVFVLAVDREQLENSAKKAFGRDLNFDEYYRKFVHRELSIPKITDVGYQNLFNYYLKIYIDIVIPESGYGHESRLNLNQDCNDTFNYSIKHISDLLKMTPRQIQYLYRTLGHMFEINKSYNLLYSYVECCIFMVALKICNHSLFQSIGLDNFSYVPILDYLIEIKLEDKRLIKAIITADADYEWQENELSKLKIFKLDKSKLDEFINSSYQRRTNDNFNLLVVAYTRIQEFNIKYNT